MIKLTRRQFASLPAAALATQTTSRALPAFAQSPSSLKTPPMLSPGRPIPSTGEPLPPVGLGTAAVFDVADPATLQNARAVVRALIENGGKLIDTASTYGDAERILGDAIGPSNMRNKIFIATKLEAADVEELKRSLNRLQTATLDLLQLHNVRNPQQSLAAFREWKAQGVCRYIGVTSTSHGAFAAVEAILGREKPDFVQIDYSIDDREAEQRILPLAAEVKAGVLTALPFGRGRLFRAVHGRTLPDWAQSFARSWAQFFLKYLLSDPRVTAVIPGTADPAHMMDNLGAMRGPLPDPDQRRQMVQFIETL
jgi:aryl-alcohol dehydrogenase-like predicted oxidoreductase